MVRWVGIVFALFQVIAYSGSYPPGFRAMGTVGSLVYAILNTALWIASRRDLNERGIVWLALGTLALDFVAMAGFVSLFTFDANNPVWVLLYILPLEGALLFQRRGAIGMMALAGIFYTARELVEEQVYGVPFILDGVTFRLGVGFIIAAVAGVMHSNLMTERDRASKGEQRLEGLLRNSQDITSVIDATGKITYTSPTAVDIVGYEVEEIMDNVGFDFVVPDDVPITERFLAEVSSSPGARAEAVFRIRRKDGEIRWVSMRGTNALHDPAINGIVTSVQDVTEMKNSQDALASVNSRYATLLANLPGMAYRCLNDEDWTLEFVSEGALQLTGYTADELVETTVFNDLVHPDDKDRVWAEVQAALDVDAPFELEYRIITRDGTEKWVWEQGRRVAEAEEAFLEGLLIDVTERKALELELSQAQKMEAVGRLAGGIAHDFNNLMAVVTNYADFIAEDLPDESPMREDIKEIHSAGVRGADLVRQLLTFSRKALIAPTVLTVDDVVMNMINLLRRSVTEDIQIKTSLDSRHPVLFDRGQLEQVLLNLVVNARDAMSQGGALTISTHSATEAGANGETQDWVVLTVSDDGEGIAPDAMEHIFEPFFTTKEPGKGTGLGLATVHGIVHKAGGRIDVTSEMGSGTTFHIRLPATTAVTADEVTPGSTSAPSATTNRTILVVEDEEAVRNLVGRILNQAGHEVICASTPSEALKALEERGVDLVITDVVMPEFSGHALVQELRRRGTTAPVIFMSGYDDEVVADRGVLEGNVLIQKPFTAAALLEAVNEGLRA